MRHTLPSPTTLLKLLESLPIRVVERATVEGEDGSRYTVRGYLDKNQKEIVVGKTYTRSWGGADDVVQVVIHELLHAAVPAASEAWVKRKDMQFFKIPELREAVAIRLLDLVMFGKGNPR